VLVLATVLVLVLVLVLAVIPSKVARVGWQDSSLNYP